VKNLTTLVITLGLVFGAGLACDKFKGTTNDATPSNTSTNSNANKSNSATTNTAKSESKAPEKADFTVTAEEFDSEFYKKGVKSSDLEKYAKKNIAVSGRVSMLVTEKKGTTQPWVTLYAPGVLHGVSCYFDDDNVDQMKKLTMDKNAKVQGFMDDLIVPEVSPMLQHCVVLEGN